MGLLRGALKAGVMMKAAEIARREASKPENQRRARELFEKVTSRGGGSRRRGYR